MFQQPSIQSQDSPLKSNEFNFTGKYEIKTPKPAISHHPLLRYHTYGFETEKLHSLKGQRNNEPQSQTEIHWVPNDFMIYELQKDVFDWFEQKKIRFGHAEDLLNAMIKVYNKNKRDCIQQYRSKNLTDSKLLKRRLKKQISIKT